MKIILHIGTHKTGTTAVQHFCMDNRAFLAKHGIHWPEEKLFSKSKQHSGLAHYIMNGDTESFSKYIGRAIACAETENHHTLFLSGEGFCHFHNGHIKTLRQLLSEHKVYIIIGFRNVYDYALSALSQRLKVTHEFKLANNLPRGLTFALNYAGTIKRWEKQFSSENVKVFSYENIKKNLIPEFLYFLDIPKKKTKVIALQNQVIQNNSIDLSTQLLLAGSGYNETMKKFKEAREIYSSSFNDKMTLPIDYFLSKSIIHNIKFNLKHPKLKLLRQELTKGPTLISSEQDTMAYLENLAIFIKKLSRHHKKQRIKAKLKRYLSRIKLEFLIQ